MSRKRYYGSADEFAEKKDAVYYLKHVFIGSCVVYTVFVLFLSVIITMINTGENEGVVFFRDIAFLYPLSLVIACANALFANKNINIWVRLLSHAAIVFGGFALYLVIVKQYAVNSIVALTPAFAVVYALIMTVVLILRNIKNKNERDDSEYTAVYANITEAQKNKKTNIKK